MTYKEIFESELRRHGLNWCRACNARSSHKRGFVFRDDTKTIHLDSEIATRSTLHRALHEIGHCVNDERGMRSYEREEAAESFSTNTMRSYGVSVPRKVSRAGASYIERKKRHGDNIRRGTR